MGSRDWQRPSLDAGPDEPDQFSDGRAMTSMVTPVSGARPRRASQVTNVASDRFRKRDVGAS